MDRRKSFHEMSPPSDEAPYDRYAIAGGYFNSLVGNSHVPTNISRYEEEVTYSIRMNVPTMNFFPPALKVYNAFKQFGNNNSNNYSAGGPYAGAGRERERFEVYKTMAERAAEFGRNEYDFILFFASIPPI